MPTMHDTLHVSSNCADLENLSERIDELNGTVRVRELPFQFTLDLYGRSKLAANYTHMLKTGVVAQQSSDSSFKCGQCLFDLPALAHEPIDAIPILYLVHGNSFLPGYIPANRKTRRSCPKNKKGRELCGLAAPSNQTKGFYKSNRRIHSITSLVGESRAGCGESRIRRPSESVPKTLLRWLPQVI